MKRLLAFFFSVSFYIAYAQKNIDGLILAEKSFAGRSVANGAKDAFLNYLDSSGIVFEQGKAMNGIEAWQKKENRSFVLNWWPLHAEISSANDFGYTTGPWELRPNAGKDSATARGRFTTVWHIDASGEWKFLVDLGVGNSPEAENSGTEKIHAKKIPGLASSTELLKAEQSFIGAYKNNKTKAYQHYLSKNSILNRNGPSQPAIAGKSRTKMIENTPSTIEYTISGSGIAPGGDLAYVYGNTLINGKPENYLRIWRREKQGWRIALEVLRY